MARWIVTNTTELLTQTFTAGQIVEGDAEFLDKLNAAGAFLVEEGLLPVVDQFAEVARQRKLKGVGSTHLDLLMRGSRVAANAPPLVNNTVYLDAAIGDDDDGNPNNSSLPFKTLDRAVEAATGLLPSQGNQVDIVARPGVYVFGAPPINGVLPSYVNLRGEGGSSLVRLVAAVQSSPILTLSPECAVRGLTLLGASSPGGKGLYCSGVGNFAAYDLRCFDCYDAFQASSGAVVNLVDCVGIHFPGATMNRVFVGDTGALLLASLCGSVSAGAIPVVGLELTDAGCFGTDFRSTAETGMLLKGSAVASLRPLFVDCEVGVNMAPDSVGFVNIALAIFENVSQWEILNESSDASVFLADCIVDETKISNVGRVQGTRHNRNPAGEIGLVCEGSFSVGSATAPARSAFGGGGPVASNMVVLSNTSLEAGTWVDNTADAVSTAGSTFELLPTAADACAYIGYKGRFFGMRFAVTAALVNPDNAIDYWSSAGGGTWVELPYRWMTSDALAPYQRFGVALLHKTGLLDMHTQAPSDWLSKTLTTDPGGYGSLYWLRIRNVNAVTTAPTIESVKVHTESLIIGPEGHIELFGGHEEISLPIRGLIGSGSTPGDQNLFPGVETSVGLERNQFSGLQDREIGGLFVEPAGLDTSQPGRAKINWQPEAAGDGAAYVRWEVWAANVEEDDVVPRTPPGALAEAATQVDTVAPTVADKGITTFLDVDLSGVVIGGNALALMIRRKGSTDTFGSNVTIRWIEFTGAAAAYGGYRP